MKVKREYFKLAPDSSRFCGTIWGFLILKVMNLFYPNLPRKLVLLDMD